MTASILTCDELAKNETDLKKIAELLVTLQSSATPTSLLLPWFPSTARKEKRQANTILYTMLYAYVEARRRAEPTTDAIDVLIAEGDANHSIISVSLSPKAL
jgi:cytochrome P450